MSDQELRELERAASTGDLAARWRLVHALERLGEKRRSFSELCKLARSGDLDAARSVREAAPCPEVGTLSFPGKGVREPVQVRRSPVEEPLELLASSESVFFIDRRGNVRRASWEDPLSRAPQPFPPKWSAGLIGNDVACLDGDAITVFDARGVVRARAEVLDADFGFVAGDRYLLERRTDEERIVEVFHVSERAIEKLWSSPAPATAAWARITLGAVFVSAGETVTCHDIDTGRVRWKTQGVAGASDARAIAVQHASRGALELVDARSGSSIWTLAASTSTSIVLGESSVVVHDTESISAVDRASGSVLWTKRGSFRAVALTDDTVFATFLEKELVLEGYDARTGERVLRVPTASGASARETMVAARGRLLLSTPQELLDILPA